MQTGQLSSWGAHFPLSPAIILVSGTVKPNLYFDESSEIWSLPGLQCLADALDYRRRSDLIPVDGGSVPAHTRLKRPKMWPICDIRYASKHELLFLYVFQRTKASQDIPPSVYRLLVFCVHDSKVRCLSVLCRVGYANSN